MKKKPPDYCSGVPDGDWGESACKPHDEDYDRGGWLHDKWIADMKLAWRIATTPKKERVDTSDHERLIVRLHDQLYPPGMSIGEREAITDEMSGINKKIGRAKDEHPYSTIKHRLFHLGAAVLYGLGVIVLHPVYKVWGWTRGKQVGFRWGRRNS